MSFHTTESRALQGRSEGSVATRLRFHGSPVSAIKPPHFAELGSKDPEMLDVWSGLLDEFLDRRAAHRFQRYAVSHAGYRWKPKLALVLPEKFSVERVAHRHDLSVALEVLASAMDHYNIDVVSDSPDAARLFQEVVPFSHKAISACAGALVLLSRSLNDEVGAIRPSRYVAADPCAYRINQKRIVFAASGVEVSFAPAGDGEIAREVRGSISVLLDEDDELPSFLDALLRLRARGLPLRLTLSSRADEDFARRVQAAFDEDLRVEVHDSEPCGFGGRAEFQISNDPISLLTQRKSTLSRFLFRRSEFWRVGQETLCRSDLYLFRGEESNAHGLLRAWLGPRAHEESRPATPHLVGVIEPLVSIIVPIYDRTAEIIRLARSIYEQDYPWIEVVFISNGSPPETNEAIRATENYLMKRRFRVRIIELARAYGSATIPRDLGIRASSGDLICVLDSDDWLDPGFFTFLRQGPWRNDTLYYPKKVFHDHGRAMGDSFLFEQTISGLGTLESADLISALRRLGNFMNNSGVCFARALFNRAGGIDHRLSYGEDLYLWWRSALAGGRAEEHDGRVNISLHPGNNELVVGEKSRLEEACELARGRELIQWL